MCNAFNTYFVNIGHTLSSPFVNSGDCMQYVTTNNHLHFLLRVHQKKLILLFLWLKNGKSPWF